MAGHVIPLNDCRRQGMGLYWNWRSQRDSTSNVRHRDVTATGGDVTRRFRGLRGEAGSKSERNRNPHAAGRRIRRLDPLIHNPDHQDQQQHQQCQRLPRQRRRHRNEMTSRTSVDVTDSTPRYLCTSCGHLTTSRTTIDDVTTLTSRDNVISRSPRVPMTSPLTLLTPIPRRRRHNDHATWSRSNGTDWDLSGLLGSPGRMSCIQLQLVEEQDNLALVQASLVNLFIYLFICSIATK